MIASFEDLKKRAREKGTKRLVVACAEERTVLEAVSNAAEEGFIEPILVGDKTRINTINTTHNISINENWIRDVGDPEEAVRISVEIVSSGEGDLLLKGQIRTSKFLKGVLDPDIGLRTGRRLSHSAILETRGYHKILQFTDGGMNIRPDLDTKIDIIRNAHDFALRLGIGKPKIALLSATEVVTPDMPETIDAAIIKQMAERGQLGCDMLIDGPLALDLAISREACRIKKIESDVAGDADILIVPDIAAGNIAAKSLIHLGGARAAGIILGARAPVVMLSRADDVETRLNSILLGVASCRKT
jgi:phosphate butyryltransferase